MDNYYFHMDNLSVGYDKKALIHDICIGIKKGEIVTLIGPNGSGKSTILKSITRQLQIIGGKVYFDDRNLNSFSYKELSTRMAVVLTERMRPELMTCHDIVATGRYPYTGRLGILSREDEEKVEEAMRAVHAESVILTTSVMDSARGCFLHARSARNQILLFWMSLLHSWILNISWIFYPFFGIWQKRSRSQLSCLFTKSIWHRKLQIRSSA